MKKPEKKAGRTPIQVIAAQKKVRFLWVSKTEDDSKKLLETSFHGPFASRRAVNRWLLENGYERVSSYHDGALICGVIHESAYRDRNGGWNSRPAKTCYAHIVELPLKEGGEAVTVA